MWAGLSLRWVVIFKWLACWTERSKPECRVKSILTGICNFTHTHIKTWTTSTFILAWEEKGLGPQM